MRINELNDGEVLRPLRNLKVRYRSHNSQLLVSVLSQLNSANALISYFFEDHFNIILHLHLVSQAVLQNRLRASLIPSMNAACTTHPSLLHTIILIT